VEKIRRYIRVSGVWEIARRYFVMNAFDGALTMLGVVVGAYIGGVNDPRFILSAGLAGSIALGVSGISGAYLAEKAERTLKLGKLEEAMLTDLEDTLHGHASRFAPVFTALVNGISPALAAFIILTPFLFASYGMFDMASAFYYSVGITFLLLFALGAYLGKISRQSIVGYGARMIVVGGLTVALSWGVASTLG